jgi:hypothetical protein
MVNKGIPLCETALMNPILAVKVVARQWSPVPNTILFFIASFLVVGRSIMRADGLSETILQERNMSISMQQIVNSKRIKCHGSQDK